MHHAPNVAQRDVIALGETAQTVDEGGVHRAQEIVHDAPLLVGTAGRCQAPRLNRRAIYGPRMVSSVKERSPRRGVAGPLKYFGPLPGKYRPINPGNGPLASAMQNTLPRVSK